MVPIAPFWLATEKTSDPLKKSPVNEQHSRSMKGSSLEGY